MVVSKLYKTGKYSARKASPAEMRCKLHSFAGLPENVTRNRDAAVTWLSKKIVLQPKGTPYIQYPFSVSISIVVAK